MINHCQLGALKNITTKQINKLANTTEAYVKTIAVSQSNTNSIRNTILHITLFAVRLQDVTILHHFAPTVRDMSCQSHCDCGTLLPIKLHKEKTNNLLSIPGAASPDCQAVRCFSVSFVD